MEIDLLALLERLALIAARCIALSIFDARSCGVVTVLPDVWQAPKAIAQVANNSVFLK